MSALLYAVPDLDADQPDAAPVDHVNWGECVPALRSLQGRSVELLADTAGVPERVITGLEDGGRELTIVQAWRLCQALCVDPEALFPDD